MNEIVLVGAIGDQKIAFRACAIEAVVDIASVVAIPFAPPHVVGIAAIRSQVVTVVDCGLALGTAACGATGRSVLTLIDGHRYALRIDMIDDVATHQVLDGQGDLTMSGAWSALTAGRIDLGDRFALLIDPAALVAVEMNAIAA